MVMGNREGALRDDKLAATEHIWMHDALMLISSRHQSGLILNILNDQGKHKDCSLPIT